MTGGGQGVATGRRAAGADPAGHGPGHRRRHRRVALGIVARRPRSGDCAAIGFFTSIEARLAGPLDRRQLLDADGRRHRPVPGTRVLRPTYLPYRVPLTTTSETPLPESDPSGWRLGYETPAARRSRSSSVLRPLANSPTMAGESRP
jgi:hypothetical protein